MVVVFHFFLVVGLLFSSGYASESVLYLDKEFPLGVIGCNVSEGLCLRGEICVDDNLFGNCQPRSREIDRYQYRLDFDFIDYLIEQLSTLMSNQFSWLDPFAQCLIQNLLASYRFDLDYSPSHCSKFRDDLPNAVEGEVVAALQDAYNDEYNIERLEKYLKLLGVEEEPFKRDDNDDEFRVHKYFGQRDNPEKRRLYDSFLFDLLSSRERDSPYDFDPERRFDGPGEDWNQPERRSDGRGEGWKQPDIFTDESFSSPYAANMEAEDPSLYPDLEAENPLLPRREEVSDESIYRAVMDLMADEANQEQVDENELNYEPPLQNPDMLTMNYPSEPEIPDMLRNQYINDEPSESSENDMTLSPEKYQLFGEILSGRKDPDELSEEQQNDMLPFVERVMEEEIANAVENAADQEEVPPEEIADEEIAPAMMREGEMTDDDSNSLSDGQNMPPEEGSLAPDEGSLAPDEGSLELDAGGATDEEEATLDDIFGGKEDNSNIPPESLPLMESEKRQADEPVEDVVPDEPDKEEQEDSQENSDDIDKPKVEKKIVDATYAYLEFAQRLNDVSLDKLLTELTRILGIEPSVFADIRLINGKNKITFQVLPNFKANASTVAREAKQHENEIERNTGLKIVNVGIGKDEQSQIEVLDNEEQNHNYFVLTFVLCGSIAGILLAIVLIYLFRRHHRSKQKLASLGAQPDNTEAPLDYQDLCRQRMQSKSSEKPEPLHAASRIGSSSEAQVRSPSSRSSTSSWSEEPVASNMDITTGHIVLSYMEDHLKNKDRLDLEWEGLCSYEADPSSSTVAVDNSNVRKNRYTDILPYDHSRAVLATSANVSGSDFINASFITDHDPRNPAYIATQGPLPHTVADFWQMVWEQGSVVIVMLTKLTENGEAMCHRYWPEEGSDLYHIYEVHLVSEHIWCDDYLVRSFYLKNLQTNETRTVTQFHFLTWHDLGIPNSIKALLDFRRKVNKSYRGRACPIVVHCSDGCGRTGTYSLIDMVLSRMAKGAKEIDIAATLEHIRDQRMFMVKTKEQFQFALAAVAEEVHAILKALPQ